MEYEDSLKKIVKGAGIILGGTIFARILTFLYNIIIARIGAEVYGLFSISLAVLNVIVTLGILGLETGIVRYISHYKGKQELGLIKGAIKSTLKTGLLMSLIFTLLLFVFADWISIYFFNNIQLTPFLKIIALAVPSTILSAILLRTLRSYLYAKYETYIKLLFESSAKIIFTLIFFALGFKVLGAAMAYSAALLGTLFFSAYYVQKKVLFKLRQIKPINPPKKELIFYSLPLMFNEIGITSILWIDTFMIPYFLDARSAGIYNVIILIVMMMSIVPHSLIYLFLPILTEFHSQNKKEIFVSLYKTCTKWIFAANIVIFAVFLLIPMEFIKVFFKEEYLKDSLVIFDTTFPISIIILCILLIGFLIFNTLLSSKDILIIFKKTKFIAFNTIIAIFANILLNYYLIPILGIIGAAIATTFSFIIGAVLIGIEAYIITKINVFKFNYFTIIFSAIFSLFLTFIFKDLLKLDDISSLVVYPSIFTLLYLLLLFITKSFEKEDIYIMNVLKRKLTNRSS